MFNARMDVSGKKEKVIAVFYMNKKEFRKVAFGSLTENDFTSMPINDSDYARAKYIRDNQGKYDLEDPYSKETLERLILWGSSNFIQENIDTYCKKYGFKCVPN